MYIVLNHTLVILAIGGVLSNCALFMDLPISHCESFRTIALIFASATLLLFMLRRRFSKRVSN